MIVRFFYDVWQIEELNKYVKKELGYALTLSYGTCNLNKKSRKSHENIIN